MVKEPRLLDLVLLHLQERNCKANAWAPQHDETFEDIAWITVVVGDNYFYVSKKAPLVLRITTKDETLADLDVLSPTMFDELDATLGIVHGGDSGSPGACPI